MVLCVFAQQLSVVAQSFVPGSIDTSFNFGRPHFTSLHNGADSLAGDGASGVVLHAEVDVSGKVLICGTFDRFNKTPRNRIARLNENGTIDPAFNPGTGATGVLFPIISSFARQQDGKYIIVGDFTMYNGVSRNRIARINDNGTLDLSFVPSTGLNATISSLCIQSNGSVVIGGNFTTHSGRTRNRVSRVLANGNIDTTFNPGTGANGAVNTTMLLPDGKILVGGNFTSFNGSVRNRIVRLHSNGSLDTSFNSGSGFNGEVSSMQLQADGKVLIVGNFTQYNGTPQRSIVRIMSDGTIDTAFQSSINTNGHIFTAKILSNGMILLGGSFTVFNGNPAVRLARLFPNGQFDSTFNIGAGASNSVRTIANHASSSSIYIGGNFNAFNQVANYFFARINANGQLDSNFNVQVGAHGYVTATLKLASGKILVAGSFQYFNGVLRPSLARLHPDGRLDTSFRPASISYGIINKMSLQPDGKVIITNSNSIIRLDSTGNLDLSFINLGSQPSGISTHLLQPDGKILVAGSFTQFNNLFCDMVIRLNPDGTVDNTFQRGINVQSVFIEFVQSLALQPDGKILVGGDFSSYAGIPAVNALRLHPNGALDSSFQSGFSTIAAGVEVIKIQPDGKILFGGSFSTYSGVSRMNIVRVHSNGSLDTSFNPGTGTNGKVLSMVLQPDGKIIMVGEFTNFNGSLRNRIVRLSTNGSNDLSFITGSGASDYVGDLMLFPDTRLLISGGFFSYDRAYRSGLCFIYTSNCNIEISNTTDTNTICHGSSKVLSGTTGGNWIIAHGPGSVVGSTYHATGGGGRVFIYNQVGDCFSNLISFEVDTASAPIISLPSPACRGSSFLISPISGGVLYRFYQQPFAGMPVAGGNGVTSYVTPPLDSSTTYYVTSVSANGCESPNRTALTLNILNDPQVTINRIGDTLRASSPFRAYQWLRNSIEIQGATANMLIPISDGIYTLRVVDSSGCIGTSNAINIVSTSISESGKSMQWRTYPVPFTNQLTIEAESAFSFELFDFWGRLIRQGAVNDNSTIIETQHLASGVYLVKVMIKDQTAFRRVMKQ